MNETMNFAKKKLYEGLVYARTAEDVWQEIYEFMQSVTHTDAYVNVGTVNVGTHLAEIKCGCERLFISLSDDGTLSFRHGVTIEVRSMGGAIFATEPKFTRPLYKSFNVDGECYAKDAYNGILKDAFHTLIDVLFEEQIFVQARD